jgi:hypothetical protein
MTTPNLQVSPQRDSEWNREQLQQVLPAAILKMLERQISVSSSNTGAVAKDYAIQFLGPVGNPTYQ